MAKTKNKTLKNKTDEIAKATVCIDFGNGDVKVMAQLPNASKWNRFSFPSFIAETEPTSASALTVISDDGLKTYAVGEPARDLPLSRTGAAVGKKAEFSNVLFLHALRQVFGVPDKDVHCDVIFTAPSVKEYGDEMVERLENRHHVQIPSNEFVPGSHVQNYVVEVHRAIPMLEGHLGVFSVASKHGSPVWAVDIGNRTINVTKVGADGGILERRVFDESGVYFLAQAIADDGLLAPELKTPKPQQVIDVLFSPDESTAIKIAPALTATLAPILDFIDDSPRYLIGGGALLPGAVALLDAEVVSDPQWSNISEIARLSAQVLG